MRFLIGKYAMTDMTAKMVKIILLTDMSAQRPRTSHVINRNLRSRVIAHDPQVDSVCDSDDD